MLFRSIRKSGSDLVTDSQETDGRRAGRGYARCAREKMRRGWGLGGPVPPIPLAACCNLLHGNAKKRLTVSWVRTQLAVFGIVSSESGQSKWGVSPLSNNTLKTIKKR